MMDIYTEVNSNVLNKTDDEKHYVHEDISDVKSKTDGETE